MLLRPKSYRFTMYKKIRLLIIRKLQVGWKSRVRNQLSFCLKKPQAWRV